MLRVADAMMWWYDRVVGIEETEETKEEAEEGAEEEGVKSEYDLGGWRGRLGVFGNCEGDGVVAKGARAAKVGDGGCLRGGSG